MKNKRLYYLLPIFLLTLILSSCSVVEGILPKAIEPAPTTAPAAPTEQVAVGEPVLGLATVESVEIQILESFPVQVNVRFTGIFPDDCSNINDIVTQQEGNNFNVVVTTRQESGANCNTAEVIFEETLPLDVADLKAGSYTVDVNGVQGSFRLDVDNVLQEEPAADAVTPTAEPTAEPTAPAAETFTVNGRVWHDLCTAAAGTEGEIPEGCVTAADGSLIADGLLGDEPGIEGVLVDLGPGPCPAAEKIITATTDAEGIFSFGNLPAADYCISVDTAGLQNEAILQPGRWSIGAADKAEVSISVGPDAEAPAVLWGWDYDLLPIDLANCTNSLEFVEDLNVPDDTVFAPGEAFTKQWKLRNNGTCPWNTDYAVVFVGGDQMGAEDSIPLTEQVAFAKTLDVAVDMIAPDVPGTYRGNWQLANADGEPFGIDGNIEDAFWLRIVVEEGAVPAATALPNSAAIGGVVWDDFCINSNPGRGCVESVDAGVFVGDGNFDGLEVALSEITISLAKGACPAEGTLPGTILETAVTDEDGRYLFDGLDTGTYCIFMDALSTENVDALIPGNWTWPGTGVGRYTFVLDPGEQALDLDFGWDFVD